MILIPGSLSFDKLVMMSPASVKKSEGDARYVNQDPFIHSGNDNVVPYNLNSKL